MASSSQLNLLGAQSLAYLARLCLLLCFARERKTLSELDDFAFFEIQKQGRTFV
jgi:hypothetical protein